MDVTKTQIDRLFRKSVLLSIMTLGLSACSFEAKLFSIFSTQISGKIETSLGQLSTDELCKVKLYELNTEGQKSSLLDEADLDSTTHRFAFSNPPRDVVDARTKYSIEYICNDLLFQRFLTDYKEQNLNYGTTLLSWLSYSTKKSLVPLKKPQEWQKIYDALKNSEDFSEAYAFINEHLDLATSFMDHFHSPPQELEAAAPQILSSTVPPTMREGLSLSLEVKTIHWQPTYSQVVLWTLGDTPISTAKSFNYIPTKNTQGNKVIKVFVGMNDGSGNIDFTKVYLKREFPVKISNDYPPIAPPFSRISNYYTNTTTVDLSVNTGPLLGGVYQNCETFSKFTLTEEATETIHTPPVHFSRLCDTPMAQDLAFTLSGAQGLRYIKLWAQDSAGNVSAVPTHIPVIYDSIAPSFKILSLNGGQSVAPLSEVEITWETTEPNPGTINIRYSLDNGATWITEATGITNTGSYIWTTPSSTSDLALVEISMTDLAGNFGSNRSESVFSINSLLPPPPVISLASDALSNNTEVSANVTCQAQLAFILLTESSTPPSASHPDWASCQSVMSGTVSTGDGNKTLYAWSKDSSGRVSDTSNSISMTLDQTPPVVTLTSHNSGAFSSRIAQNITWTVTDSHLGATPASISYSGDMTSWSEIAANQSATGPWAWPASFVNSSSIRIKVAACDLAGNCAEDTSNQNITLDGEPPTVTQTQINAGATLTTNNYISVEFTANDTLSGVSKYCFIPTLLSTPPTKPSSAHACWNSIAQSPAVTLTRTAYLGLDEGLYTLYVWAMDASGNISDIGTPTTPETDNDFISYGVPKPPKLVNVSASTSDGSSFPPSPNHLFAPSGAPLYIKWKIVEDPDVNLTATPISIQYSTDGVTFVNLSGAQNIQNGVNGSCSVDGSTFTGCFYLPTSNGGPYQFRVTAQTQSTIKSSALTSIINLSNSSDPYQYRILAGNVSRSLNENALSSIIVPTDVHQGSMAMDSKGVLYIFDYNVGVVKMDPNKGVLEPVLKMTGTSTGNGGHHLDATMTERAKIVVDGLDRLVIWDNTQIRRIDPVTGIITNIVGPGNTFGTNIDGPNYRVHAMNPGASGNVLRPNFFFQALPNGDVVFRSGSITYAGLYNDGGRIARYSNATGKVSDVTITANLPGYGDTSNLMIGGIYMDFDPVTSEPTFMKVGVCQMDPSVSHTGCKADSLNRVTTVNLTTWQLNDDLLDQPSRYGIKSPPGTMYGYESGRIWKYNISQKEWEPQHIAGTGNVGYCDDNTLEVTNCDLALKDAYVSPFGQIYVWDGNLIRIIDPQNKFKTIVGQRLSSGDNGPALSARIAQVGSFDILSSPSSTRLVFIESSQYKMRNIVLDGLDIITHLAGNGKSGTTSTAGVNVLNLPGTFGNVNIKPDTNEVYVTRSGVMKINSSQEWERVALAAPNGSIYWYGVNGDGAPGLNQRGAGSPVLQYISSTFAIVSNWVYLGSGAVSASYLKLYDTTDSWRQYNLAGDSTSNGVNNRLGDQNGSYGQNFPGAGSPKVTSFSFDSAANEFLFLNTHTGEQKFITRYHFHNSNADYDYNDPGDTYDYYQLQHDANSFVSVRNAANQLVLYYCRTNGVLYKQNMTLSTAPVELTSNFSSVKCSGDKMRLDRNRRSVIFPFQQNDLWGFAEVVDLADIPASP